MEPPQEREFVGFVWQDDLSDATGVLVMARTPGEAGDIVRETFGAGYRVSIWNEDDAARPR